MHPEEIDAILEDEATINNEYFHIFSKCGPLEQRYETVRNRGDRVDATLRKLYCLTHDVMCWECGPQAGWQIGFHYGTDSRALSDLVMSDYVKGLRTPLTERLLSESEAEANTPPSNEKDRSQNLTQTKTPPSTIRRIQTKETKPRFNLSD